MMTRNVGLAGAASLFGTQLNNDELAALEEIETIMSEVLAA